MKTTIRKPIRIAGKATTQLGSTSSVRANASTSTIELVPALLHLKSILVPIDFSANSEKALVYAVAFAEQFGARITLLTVVEPIVVPEYASLLMGEHGKWLKSAKARLGSRQNAV